MHDVTTVDVHIYISKERNIESLFIRCLMLYVKEMVAVN